MLQVGSHLSSTRYWIVSWDMRQYGSLKADGIVGSGTCKAITAFQRANKIHVMGELDAPTLRLVTPGRLASQ